MKRQILRMLVILALLMGVAACARSRGRFGSIIVQKLYVQDGGIDMLGNKIDLDDDNDTSITVDTDDQIDVEISGADDFQFTANTFTALAGSTVSLPATSDLSVLGYVNIGDGTPDGAVTDGNDEELYVEGELEVDGEAEFDGAVDADGGMTIDGGVTNVGGGSPDVAAGDNDLFVTADLEVDGELELDGALDADSTANIAGATTFGADVTVSEESTGGNAGAKNEISGLLRVKVVALGTMTDGSAQTVSYIDTSPTGEWAEVDGGTNITVTADTGTYHQTTNSVKLDIDAVTDNEGVDGTITQDDLSGNESLGFWIYSTQALTSGDFDVTLDDTDGTDQTYNVPAVSADTWTWVELDISGCDANCDTTDGVQFLATSQGAGNLTAVDIYLDGMFKWDADDEEALSTAIIQDGVLGVWTIPTAAGTANTQAVPALYTDYFIHYESGNDFLVTITDQSANSGMALIAY